MSAILWRWIGRPGHEASRLIRTGAGWRLEGSAALRNDGEACGLTYRIECDEEWRTRTAEVRGFVGVHDVHVDVAVSRDGRWSLNGTEAAAVSGCIDIDLNFSPSTNTLPIRRLALGVGEESPVRAAWLRFPSFTLEVLEQRYRRLSENRYEYESASFRAEIVVDDDGLATDYAGVWTAER